MLFLTTTFVKICAQATCWVLRVRRAWRCYFACFASIDMMSQARRPAVFTGVLVVEVLMTQTQSRPQLECNVFSQANRGLSLQCGRPRTITRHITHIFREKIPWNKSFRSNCARFRATTAWSRKPAKTIDAAAYHSPGTHTITLGRRLKSAPKVESTRVWSRESSCDARA